jgi:hypothetical protein
MKILVFLEYIYRKCNCIVCYVGYEVITELSHETLLLLKQ